VQIIDTGGPGGAETMFSQLAHRLDGRPLRSVPILSREGWLSAQLEGASIKPVILKTHGSMDVSYLCRLVRRAAKSNASLIHSHLLGSSVYGALAGALLGVPVIAVFHGPSDVLWPGRMRRMKRWLLQNRCSRIVAVSESTRAGLESFGIPSGRVTLIRNGVDTRVFSPGAASDLRAELGLRPSDILIGAVGNIRAPKAYDVALRAAAQVVTRLNNVHFAVVGSGAQQDVEALTRLRDSLGLNSKFHFLGFRNTGSSLFGNFDVFFSSSRSEGLPLAFLEGMACNLCVVATESGGAQEVVESGRSGLLVPSENPDALAAALISVATDSTLRCRLGAEGRARVLKEFSLDKTVSRYRELYEELLSMRRHVRAE
jgi:glycosyltransferase involved in cell wall biosynthesis